MRSYDPEDQWDREELVQLLAEPWMLECLSLNPSYVHWGPGEDYMSTRDQGWSTSSVTPTWREFGPLELDDWNEVVHFYFHVNRDSKACTARDRSGLNPETAQISEDFYDFAGTGRRWRDNITQDEVDALIEGNRLWDFWRKFGPDGWEDIEPRPTVTAEMVNAWEKREMLGHDAINQSILVRTRAKRLGVYGKCAHCHGRGSIFTEPSAKLGLTVWVLHPRKGASKGMRIEEIAKDELPAVKTWLVGAAKRGTERFARVVASLKGGS